MKKKSFYILLMGLIVVGISCQKMEYDQQFSSTYPISGEWSVKYEYPDGSGGKVIAGPYLIYAFNTSFSKDSIWLQDQGNHSDVNFGPYQFKAKASMSDLTFLTANSPSSITLTVSGKQVTYTDVCTKLQSGKIVNKDSIYFEAIFASDPTTTYKVYGHRRNSWEEYNNLK
jgi:hypothetical protein